MVFLYLEGLSGPEIARRIENFQRARAVPVDAEIELETLAARQGSELPSVDSRLFRVRAGACLPLWVREELEHWHRQQVQQTALRDRFQIYERELNRKRSN